MARGWESKSVEEQQSEFAKSSAQDSRQVRSPEDKQREQRRQALQLARTNVQNQLKNAQNDRHKQLLLQELDHLEAEIARLAS